MADVKKWVGREAVATLDGPWPKDLAEKLDVPLITGPYGTVTVRNTGGGSLVADIQGVATVRAECARCLEPVHIEVPFDDSQEFREDDPGLDGEWLQYDHDTIPLDDLVTDALLLAMPLKPLCRADCQGICVKCGADRNVAPCACAVDRDERWAQLERFKPGR